MENLEALKAVCEALLTTTQAATMKQVSRQAVADAVKAGTLKAIREKPPRLFRREDVEAWTPYGALIKRQAKERQARPPPAPLAAAAAAAAPPTPAASGAEGAARAADGDDGRPRPCTNRRGGGGAGQYGE